MFSCNSSADSLKAQSSLKTPCFLSFASISSNSAMFLIHSFYLTQPAQFAHSKLLLSIVKRIWCMCVCVCLCPELLQSVQKQTQLFDSCGSRDTYSVIVAVLQKPRRNFVIGLLTATLFLLLVKMASKK